MATETASLSEVATTKESAPRENLAQTAVVTIPHTNLFFVTGRVDKPGAFISAGLHSVHDVVPVPEGRAFAMNSNPSLSAAINASLDAYKTITALPLRGKIDLGDLLEPE